MTPHEQAVIELYNKVTVEIPGITTGRAISLEAFKHAIDTMMSQAYNNGIEVGIMQAAEGIHDILR